MRPIACVFIRLPGVSRIGSWFIITPPQPAPVGGQSSRNHNHHSSSWRRRMMIMKKQRAGLLVMIGFTILNGFMVLLQLHGSATIQTLTQASYLHLSTTSSSSCLWPWSSSSSSSSREVVVESLSLRQEAMELAELRQAELDYWTQGCNAFITSIWTKMSSVVSKWKTNCKNSSRPFPILVFPP